jgi:hypothetical protein
LIKNFHKKNPSTPRHLYTVAFDSLNFRPLENFTKGEKGLAGWELGMFRRKTYRKGVMSQVGNFNHFSVLFGHIVFFIFYFSLSFTPQGIDCRQYKARDWPSYA